MQNITVEAFKVLHDAGAHFVLDVRGEAEWEIVNLPNTTLIPLHELPTRLSEIPRDIPVIALCHHGVRSQHAAHYLESCGITPVLSVMGGIDAYAECIAPALPRY